MLRAGLIGLPSAGKTTLFQLLTSAREAPRTHGKSEANVGVSRVPDDRLDRLTDAVPAGETGAGDGRVRRHGGGAR